MRLNDDDLLNVTGGMNEDEIINKINTLYTFIPEGIRNEIINALKKYGKKTAKALAEKLVSKEYKNIESLISLFN